MNVSLRQTVNQVIGTAILGILAVAGLAAQTQPVQKPILAEDVFKNVQVLRGISVSQFMETMGFISASLGLNCSDCHVSEQDWAAYARDNDMKQTARKMMLMVTLLNRGNFGGKSMVTCYTCHRGDLIPKTVPTIAGVYSTPPLDEPDEILKDAPNAPPAAQVLDKYIEAGGGAARVGTLTSIVAKGTYEGFSSEEGEKRPAQIFAKAPNQRASIVDTLNGNLATTYDGQNGWSAVPGAAVPVLALDGPDLDGVKMDAELAFPAQIKQILTDWKVGFSVTIDGKDADVLQGRMMPGGLPVKLYFDQKSGLLVRQVRYTVSPLGRNTTQVDYSDYRTVNGIKFPFHIVVSWLDGRSNFELTDVQVNAPVNPSVFQKPVAAARKAANGNP
jgi:Photosynthetic reaction centre cytochrome C subunit